MALKKLPSSYLHTENPNVPKSIFRYKFSAKFFFILFSFHLKTGWEKTRVFQEKDMGNWVFGFFLFIFGFFWFFPGFWVFLIPCILGISKYVEVGGRFLNNVLQQYKSFISPIFISLQYHR